MSADISTALKTWSTTESSNSPSGGALVGGNLDDNLRAIQVAVRALASSASVASAATVDLNAQDTATFLTVTGTTTITALGTVSAGIYKWLVFAGALTFTHNGTSLILPTGASITTAAGDVALMLSLGSGNWRCLSYTLASGQPLVNSGSFSAGTAAAPGMSFTTDTNTGIYSVGADSLGISTGGTLRVTVSTSAVTSTLKHILPNGTEGAPALSFSGVGADAGFYGGMSGADQIVGLSLGGAVVTRWSQDDDFCTMFMNMNARGSLSMYGDNRIKFNSVSGSYTPTISAGGGTGATIAGVDQAFTVTAGTGSPTSVTLTFATAFSAAPVCVATSSQSGLVLHVTPTTTNVQVSANAAISSGTKIHVMCFECS